MRKRYGGSSSYPSNKKNAGEEILSGVFLTLHEHVENKVRLWYLLVDEVVPYSGCIVTYSMERNLRDVISFGN